MSNLGEYQVFTTVSKKFGGPKNLFSISVITAAAIGTAIGSTLTYLKCKSKSKRQINQSVLYSVHQNYKSCELSLKPGDKYRILNKDGDVFLIEKIGDKNSPYFIDVETLKTISGYKQD